MSRFVEIQISRGLVTMVSEEDEQRVGAIKWTATPVKGGKIYAARTMHQKGIRWTLYLHRMIVGAQKGDIVDHINGDGLDNRRENLRIADATLNCANRRSYNPASGYRGVYRHHRRWSAQITARGKTCRGGLFDTPEEAARRYDEMARGRFGAFAVLNFPDCEA